MALNFSPFHKLTNSLYMSGGKTNTPNTSPFGGSSAGPGGSYPISPATGTATPSFSAPTVDLNKGVDEINKYIDTLISEAKGQRDLIIKKLDAEHKMALGNDDQARARFIESVADSVETKIGRIPYDYERYTKRELDEYALGNREIAESKNLAMAKLDEDERAFDANLGFDQGNENRATVEDLNARGMMEGQKVNNGLNINQTGYNPLLGLSGLAGATANVNNTGFGNLNTATKNSLGLQREGVSMEAGQAQRRLDFDHTNTMADLKVDARRDAQDQQHAYSFGKEEANANYEAMKRTLERQRARDVEAQRARNGLLG